MNQGINQEDHGQWAGSYTQPIGFRGNRRFLSNFMESKITMGAFTFPTAEAAFQAAKSLDPEDWAKIQKAPSPLAAKHLGRKVKLRSDWEEIKLAVMAEVIKAKFEQNPELKALLKATGDELLVEHNTWSDRFWGVCEGSGDNHLGRLLMEYRSTII